MSTTQLFAVAMFAILGALCWAITVYRSPPKRFTSGQLPKDLLDKMRGPVPPGTYVSNGCTCSPDYLGGQDLRPACHFHDYAYELGGTEEDRSRADYSLYRNLRRCDVSRRRANLYFRFVRVLGRWYFHYDGNRPSGWQCFLRDLVRSIIRF